MRTVPDMIRIVIQHQIYSFCFFLFQMKIKLHYTASSSCNICVLKPCYTFCTFNLVLLFKTLHCHCYSWSWHKVLPFINFCSLHMLRPKGEGGCVMDVKLLSSV